MAWQKLLDIGDLDEGRTVSITVGRRTLAVSHHEGQYGAIDNHCPHQGGPLGEGTIEPGAEDKCWLRCPWHGYDFDPIDGHAPGDHNDGPQSFATEVRGDGVYAELPDDAEAPRTVADVLVETMVAWGVNSVFGMVGHSNLGVADAMRKAEERGDLRYFGIRHEGAAAFAASAYGKLTGTPAACFAIAGPGSTNMLTGLYDAKVDRAPVLALSGQVPSKDRGRGAFQDVDLEAAFDDVARFSESVHNGSDAAELMTLALKTAIVERGPVHLVMPDEVQTIESDAKAKSPKGRVGSPLVTPTADDVTQAAQRLKATKRPLFIVGAGARDDMAEIVALAEQIGAPVATTFKAKGQISDSHPLGCGVLGRSGTPIASWFMNESDLICVFGASFSNHTGIAPYKPIIQVDDDPMMLGRFHAVDLPVRGSAGLTAALLAEVIGDDHDCHDHTAEVRQRWSIWRAEKNSRRSDDRGEGLNSAIVFEQLASLVAADAVIAVDVGNNTYSFGRYFEVKNQTVLMSGYLGSIGFGLPAALGAWAAVGDSRQIVSISGDGGFGQYAMELTTAARYDMDITHVLLNNAELGKISKEQRGAQFDVWSTELANPNFAEFAELCGAQGQRVELASELPAAFKSALAHNGPSLIEVMCDPLLT